MKTETRIKRLVAAGVRQFEICRRLGIGRGRVQNIRRSLGATVNYRGQRFPLTESEKEQVRALLLAGVGTLRISKQLNLRESSIRNFGYAEKIPFRRGPGSRLPVPPEKLAALKEAILARETDARRLAKKFALPYKQVLAVTKQTLGCDRLKTGPLKVPLDSWFPQKWAPHRWKKKADRETTARAVRR